MPLILSSNPVGIDSKTPSNREAKFGRQRFQKEQKRSPFLSRQPTNFGLFDTAGSNEGASLPHVSWSKAVTILAFTTLCVATAFCAITTDFALDFSPSYPIPVEFRIFTSRLDTFSSNRLPTTLEMGQYHIEFYFGRRPRPISTPSEPPILEYASLSAGGQAIEALTSPTYSPSKFYAIFSRAAKGARSPKVALTDGLEPGQCWPFIGDAGQLGIQLTRPIRVSFLIVGHANMSSESIASAPKNIVLWGLKPANGEVCDVLEDGGAPTGIPDFGFGYCGTRLLSGVHEPLGSTKYQKFFTSHYDEDYFDRMIVQVLGNWGNSYFTCIYSVQIYGLAQE